MDVLRRRAERHPDRRAFTFLAGGGAAEQSLTFGELDARARAIAAELLLTTAPGNRALLALPAGLDYVASLFGCFYAGIIAVPVYPPRDPRLTDRLAAIAKEARANVVLRSPLDAPGTAAAPRSPLDAPGTAAAPRSPLDAPGTAGVQPASSSFAGAPTPITPPPGQPQATPPEAIAFLQFTSGTTGTPRGVVVAHRGLMANLAMIHEAFGLTEQDIVVGWLPLFHDMGLIGNVLQNVFAGMHAILMPPEVAAARPIRWLEAISRYRGTVSGGPNFAYDWCVRRIAAARILELDLASWRIAFNGAEPVRAETLARFGEAFAPAGFRPEAFFPCYGLAEATLFVTGGPAEADAVVIEVDANALSQGVVVLEPDAEISAEICAEPDAEICAEPDPEPGVEPRAVRRLVGCGKVWGGARVAIVEPETRRPLEPGGIGEIWVAGPGVAGGYWGRPEESATTFAASFAASFALVGQPAVAADQEASAYLRTGDLGFLHQGQLFVTGRIKDMIIVHGRNHYPQDIEQTVADSDPVGVRGRTAAFAVEVDGFECLVVAYELPRRAQPASSRNSVSPPNLPDLPNPANLPDPDNPADPSDPAAIASRIRRAVRDAHDLAVHSVWLVEPGTLPVTSSGKIRRGECRARYLARGEGV